MNIGVIGLGLIGGSLARAYKRAGAAVYGYDTNHLTTDFVKLAGSIDEELTKENMNDCDCIFIAIPPSRALDWLKENAPLLQRSTTVIDCCGVKRAICSLAEELMKETELSFVGGHPMAGVQGWGFKKSSEVMFDGSTFAIVSLDKNNIELLSKVKNIIKMAGFTELIVMSAEEHDEVIAFTSQLSHIVASSFIQSDTLLLSEKTIAGGSFRDMTRVAMMDENMWSGLMQENRDNLIREIRNLISELQKYLSALENSDTDRLMELLANGREIKTETEDKINIGKRPDELKV